MITKAVNPRVLLIADSYLFGGRILDATRYTFTKTLANVSEAVCFFHANTYPQESYLEKLEATLKTFKPNLIIAMNSGCLRQGLLDYASQHQIALITWFWDSPVLFGLEQNRLARKTIVFHSDVSYKSHDGIDGTGEWMPFSSIPAVPYKRNPTKDICFQGTLWSSTRILQDAAFGLICEGDGKYYFGAALYQALTERLDKDSTWRSTTTGTVYSYGMMLNAISALKRVKTLAWFGQKDLHIYGDMEWLTYLWPLAPELLNKCHYLEAQSHEEMRTLFADHRCSLNVFHLQNRLGGPNLRILDSATHFTPILSDYNQHCHELYPHGEAAFYFKSCEEAMEGLGRILNEPGFADKLSSEAARILNSGHTHSHRIQTMFAAAQLSYEAQTKPCTVQVISTTLPEDLFTGDVQPTSAKQIESVFATAYEKPGDLSLSDREKLVEGSQMTKSEAWITYQASNEYSKFFTTEYQNLLARKEAVEAQLQKLQEEMEQPIHKLFADRIKKALSTK